MPESVTLSHLPDGFTLTEVSEPKDVGHYYASYDNTETGAFFTVMIVPFRVGRMSSWTMNTPNITRLPLTATTRFGAICLKAK